MGEYLLDNSTSNRVTGDILCRPSSGKIAAVYGPLDQSHFDDAQHSTWVKQNEGRGQPFHIGAGGRAA